MLATLVPCLVSSPIWATPIHGSLAAWGYDFYGETLVPAGHDFVAIAAGETHSLALKSDGSLVDWGDNRDGEFDSPAGHDFTAPVEWVDFVVVPPAVTIGVHLQEEDELYLIASGSGRMTVDDATYAVTTGDAVLTRAGSTHSLENTSTENITLFVLQVARV